MLMQRSGENNTACGECGVAFPARRPVVHCTNRVPRQRQAPHHGRKAWVCTACNLRLGCDVCLGRYPENILCKGCNVYLDGQAAVPLTADDMALLIEFVKHSRPERAATVARLAAGLTQSSAPRVWTESDVTHSIESLIQKGFVIEKVNDCFYFDPRRDAATVPVRQLALPLASDQSRAARRSDSPPF